MFEIDTVDGLRAKVLEVLSALSLPAQRESDGNFVVPSGSAQCHIGCDELELGPMKILRLTFSSPVLLNVPVNASLYEMIASELKTPFGGFTVDLNSSDESLATITFSYSLFGNFVNEAIISSALMFVASASDEVDDVLQQELGGQRFRDD